MSKPLVQLINPTHRPLKRPRLKNLAMPLNLAVIAANTPDECEVKITDTYVERINWAKRPDLVGITTLTASSAGAIEVARKFKAIGSTVVMGGIQTTAMPEQMLAHCDAVVCGEAENTWPELVRDFLSGRMKKIYAADPPDLADYRRPRRELVKRRKYFVNNLIETSRGCPFDCMYCSNSTVYGKAFRFRQVGDIVEEIRAMPGRFFVIVDNNVAGHPGRAKELFRALIPLRIKWVGQASITMGYDEELLRLAARSGCMGVLVGLETLKKDVLKTIGKPVDPKRYIEIIKRFQKHGIFVQGEFIFGFDEDDETVFEETLEFAERARLDSARFAILKPYPGTRFYDQCVKEGRLSEFDCSKYHSRHVVYQPVLLTPEQLRNGRDWCYRQFASFRSMWRRIGLTKRHAPLIWAMNLANHQFKNSRSR